MSTTKNRLIIGAAWIGASKILINIIGFVSTLLLARLLAPADFGLVAIASAVAMIFALITELSLSQALVQHDEPTDEHYHTAFTLNLIRGVVLTIIVGLLAWPIAKFYNDDRIFKIILGLAIGIFAGGLVNPRLAIFERNLEFRPLFLLNLAGKIAGFVVAISIAFIFRSYWALVFGQIASEVARAIASYILLRYRPRLSLSHYKELISFSIWLTLGQAVQAVNWRWCICSDACAGTIFNGRKNRKFVYRKYSTACVSSSIPCIFKAKA